MAVALPPGLLAQDLFVCLGLGLLVAALYETARFVLGNSAPICFALDVAAFALAAVLLCSFAACRSASGAPRWYMAAALLVGTQAFFGVVAPGTRRVRQLLLWALGLPFRLAFVLVWQPISKALQRLWTWVGTQIKKIFITKPRKRLKKRSKLLYNSN